MSGAIMESRHLALVVAVALAGLVGGCRSSEPKEEPEKQPEARSSGQGSVTGVATYVARMALPKDAVLTVRLEDVTRADLPAGVLGERQIRLEGRQVPIPFEIPYDPARIDENHLYVVRGTLRAGGQVLFQTAQAHPVLTRGHSATVELQMVPAGSSQPGSASGQPPLFETRWRLTELNGAPAPLVEGASAPHLVLLPDENFGGSGGVNRLLGTYEIDGAELTLVPRGTTMTAGPEKAMKFEQDFLEALGTVTSYRVSGERLELRARDRVVMRFEAEAPR